MPGLKVQVQAPANENEPEQKMCQLNFHWNEGLHMKYCQFCGDLEEHAGILLQLPPVP